MEKKTQKTNILEHLKREGKINPLQALNLYGCFRLGAVIYDLRKEGYNITTTINTKKNKKTNIAKNYAIYILKDN